MEGADEASCSSDLLDIIFGAGFLTPEGFSQSGSPIEAQHVEMAREFMKNQQWDYANYEWRSALAVNPDSFDANAGLVETLMESGYSQEAVRHMEEWRRRSDKLSIELLYGKTLERNGDFSQAKAVYLRNLERVPWQVDSFERLNALLPRLSEREQPALKSYLAQKASQAGTQAKEALKSEQYRDAVRHFQISTIYYANPADLNDYALLLLLQGNYDKATQHFNTLMNLSEEAKWAYLANASFAVLGSGKLSEAARLMEKAIGACQDSKKLAVLYNGLGFIYESQNKWQKAKSTYERALSLDPRLQKAKLNLANAYQKDRAYPDAIRVYREVLQSHPRDVRVLNRLGFVYELAHREKQAIGAYQRAAQIAPKDEESYYNLSTLYRKMGQARLADQTFKKMMNIEFGKIEAGKNKNETIGQTRSPDKSVKARLLEYVDVFFSESIS